MILDGGPCRVGLESTIVGFDGQTAVILRPGGIPLPALAEVLKGRVIRFGQEKRAVRVPGALRSHYAPETPLELCPSGSLSPSALQLAAKGLRVAVIAWSDQQMDHAENKNIVHFSMPADPMGYGRLLYETLRRFDHEQFDCLLVEAPPDEPGWMAIADRLQRASRAVQRDD
jgi:L-threonylcarbamoyladenylate synthase